MLRAVEVMEKRETTIEPIREQSRTLQEKIDEKLKTIAAHQDKNKDIQRILITIEQTRDMGPQPNKPSDHLIAKLGQLLETAKVHELSERVQKLEQELIVANDKSEKVAAKYEAAKKRLQQQTGTSQINFAQIRNNQG